MFWFTFISSVLADTSADYNCINQFVHMSCPTCTCMIPRWSCTQTKTYRKGRQKLTGCAWAWATAWAWRLKQTQSKNYYWLQCLQVSNMRNPLTESRWYSFENSCFAQQPTETYQEYVDISGICRHERSDGKVHLFRQ